MSVQPDKPRIADSRPHQHHPNRHRAAWATERAAQRRRPHCPTCEDRREVYNGPPGMDTVIACPSCNPEGRAW